MGFLIQKNNLDHANLQIFKERSNVDIASKSYFYHMN